MELDKTKQGATEDTFACCGRQIFLAEVEKIFSQEGEDKDLTLSNCVDKCPDVWDTTTRFLQTKLVVKFTGDQVLDDVSPPSSTLRNAHPVSDTPPLPR